MNPKHPSKQGPNATDFDHSVSLNGEHVALPEGGLTLTQLLQQQGFAPGSVATAVNAQFVARQARETTPLKPGDAVTLIQAIVGG
jgi:sulfur carrier protein